MLKRILSSILTLAIIITALPTVSFSNNVIYGDANSNNSVDLNDILVLKRYIAEENPQNFNPANADANADGRIDLADLLLLKKYLAEWNVTLGGGALTVNFYDGLRLIETYNATNGEPLGKTPSVEKTSKADGIFVGWYSDPGCTIPYYSENPVTANTNVYAKYEPVRGIEEVLTIDSFSKTDVESNYTLFIRGFGDPSSALTLVTKDGTAAPTLIVSPGIGGTYAVSAEGGFRPGSAYELELATGFVFVGETGDLPQTVRKTTFTVRKDIVDNLKMNDDIVYIADTPFINYSFVDSDSDNLFNDVISELKADTGINALGSTASVPGAGAMGLEPDDIICFYVGTAPKDRIYTGPNASAYIGQPEVYAKVVSAIGDSIVFAPLGEDDLTNVYDIPDIFPIKSESDNNTVNISALDLEVYAQYGIDTPTLEFAKASAAVGDFVAVYTVAREDSISFGRVTNYNAVTGDITYLPCTVDDITASRSIYVKPSVSGSELLTEESRQEIEEIMLMQIRESGFAEEAAYTLANLSTQTDGFKNMDNLRSVLLSDDSGKPLTSEEIELLNIGASFELSEDIELSVELITKGDELHFKDGLQLAVGLGAKFEVEAEDGKVVIELDATFIEELSIKPTVDGELTYFHVLGIPVPNGVHVGASVDVLNYTAYNFDVVAYTVAPEDKPLWDKFKEMAKNPSSIIDMVAESGLVPAKYASKLETAGDVFKKIEEVQKQIGDAKTKYKESKEKIEGYEEDLNALWNFVDYMHSGNVPGVEFTREGWADAARELSRTSIAQELLHLSDDGITDGDAGVDNDLTIKSVAELMEKYTETLERNTDWVTLLEQKITETSSTIKVVNFMLKVDFVIRTNMSIALGSTLEYEIGRRYSFWFEIGLYRPTGGSSTMDILDESLVFQFYVLGKLEIKMGAKITLGISIGSSEFAYAGVFVEVGPYVKLYGFFIYSYEHLRAANTLAPIKDIKKMGALYLETGIYLIVGVEASAIKGLFEVSHEFLNEEYPILNAGNVHYPYEFSYEIEEDERVVIKDSDGNSATGITMILPEQYRSLTVMNLKTGKPTDKIYSFNNFNVSLSNPNFSVNPVTGEISVTVPDGVRYMDCELRLTYRYGKMAFSDYDIGISIPLCWTNLSDLELKEYYTASVRVGNPLDGYETVWSKRVLKNSEFELPTPDEINELIGYTGGINDLKYSSGAYASNYNTIGGIIDNKVYDFNVNYKTYSIAVSGVEGSLTPTQIFTARFGEKFDFSSLALTGTNDPFNRIYTTFHNVTTDAVFAVGKDSSGNIITEPVNLESPITERIALALQQGMSAKANYVDNSVSATFVFRGIEHDDITQKLPKGGIASIAEIESIAKMNGLLVKDIKPAVSPIYSNQVYIVTFGELTGDKYTISFEENGGNEISDISKVGGSVIGSLPVPEKEFCTFGGWYLDNETFEVAFNELLMPKQDVTLYAKWEYEEYTVNFHINGGTSTTPEAITVIYGSPYGPLPEVSKTGFGFAGWYTEAEGGTLIDEDTIVELTDDITLYAHWEALKEIPKSIFSFDTQTEKLIYDKDRDYFDDVMARLNFNPEDGARYALDEFTIEFKVEQGDHELNRDYVERPKNAGTYLAKISRPASGPYAKFEATYTAVITIDKKAIPVPAGGYEIVLKNITGGSHVRALNNTTLETNAPGYIDVEIVGISDYDRAVLEESQKFQYELRIGDNWNAHESDRNGYFGEVDIQKYSIKITVKDDPNYTDVDAPTYIMHGGKKYSYIQARDAKNWREIKYPNGIASNWNAVNKNSTSFSITSAEQLACLAYYINNGTIDSSKITVTLASNIDLYQYKWISIGTEANPFKGIFNGNNRSISNLYGGALFGECEGATIKNVTITHSLISVIGSAGGIINRANIKANAPTTVIENCIFDAIVFGANDTGGIIGRAGKNTEIKNCSTTENAIVSSEKLKYYSSYTRGDYAGGIVGYMLNGASVIDCVNKAYVRGRNIIGGIIGYMHPASDITGCTNFGKIEGNGNVHGIVPGIRLDASNNCVDNGSIVILPQ